MTHKKDKLNYRDILNLASQEIQNLKGRRMDVIAVKKPSDIEYAKNFAKVLSKLSPLIGNMIEFSMVGYLNTVDDWKSVGQWERQDPGFPDTIFNGTCLPKPGIEIKTWFPLATEITARFKDSCAHFERDNINVAVIAWLPENILFGSPLLLDIWIDSAKSLAKARDMHYHNPPDYIIFEPEDTTSRTANLQQTNTNGYKFQGTEKQFKDAEKMVNSWGRGGKIYNHNQQYQQKLKSLLAKYPYRLDTNFAKIDRIMHASLERFKEKVLTTKFKNRTILEWSKLLQSENESEITTLIKEIID